MGKMIDEIVTLTRRGYHEFRGEVDQAVYEYLRCRKPVSAPRWFVDGQARVCLGCARRCSLQGDAGFQLELPLEARVTASRPTLRGPVPVFLGEIGVVPDRVVLDAKASLTPEEAAAILRISIRSIYDMVADGRLTKTSLGHCGAVRVTTDSVRRRLAGEDWSE